MVCPPCLIGLLAYPRFAFGFGFLAARPWYRCIPGVPGRLANASPRLADRPLGCRRPADRLADALFAVFGDEGLRLGPAHAVDVRGAAVEQDQRRIEGRRLPVLADWLAKLVVQPSAV